MMGSSVLLLSSNACALSKVTASIDKNPAMVNESILLTIIADDNINRNALDTSSLLTDFIVGQTSVSSQTNMVNFKTTRTTQWQVILIARRAGDFTIPALTINNHKTAPIALTVVEKRQNKSDSDIQADIFITSELSNDEVYVQQSLTLSIKLHFAIELHSASITEPSLTGAAIEKAEKDKQSDTIINGKRYRVIEQTYAITPEQSGEFTLQAPVFSGEVRNASQRRSSFLSFAQTKPVSIVGDELNLTVLPIPVSYPDNTAWLPTDILTLHQEWQSTDDEFIVGEPITRTIRLTAAGLSKAQLPKLVMKSSMGMKIYPDQAELHSTLTNGRLVSQKVQNFALVPSTAGEFILPAMSITWFNTITNKIEQATLPSETISVKAAEGSFNADGSSKYNPTENNETQLSKVTDMAETVMPQKNNVVSVVPIEDKRLQWIFLSLWVLTCLAWFTHIITLRQRDNKGSKTPTSPITNKGNHYTDILAACKKNNAEHVLSLILPWLKQLLTNNAADLPISNIAQGLALVNEQSFTTALHDLQQNLYGKNAQNDAQSWQGTSLLDAIKTVHKQFSEAEKANPLFSLNP
jgi:hypothetical protein